MPGFAGELDARDNAALRRVLCDAMPETFQWLLDSGVRFFGPMPEPPHRQPRMHNVLPNSRSFIHHLQRRAQRAGVTIRTSCPRDGSARATGPRRAAWWSTAPRSNRCARAAASSSRPATSPTAPSSRPVSWARRKPRSKASTRRPPATASCWPRRWARASSTATWHSAPSCVSSRRSARTGCAGCRRGAPLAVAMQWSLEHLPMALLRPFMMKFLTTTLAPSTTLFDDGARLVNARGERFGDESRPPGLAAARSAGQGGLHRDRRPHRARATRRGRTSSRPRRASPTRTSPTTAATGPMSTPRRRRLAALAQRLGMDAAALARSAGDAVDADRRSSRSVRCARCSCTTRAA